MTLLAERKESREKEASTKAKEAQLDAAIAAVNAMAAALAPRVFLGFVSLGAMAGFGWAIYSANGIALSGACLYTVLVFLPSLYASWKGA